jgi:mRNA (guanine-N7-)-methyltransferase
MRIFHNQIKNEIYNKYTLNKSVLELSIGKGADLGRLYNNKVTKVVGYDIDETSIIEAKKRLSKYPMDFNVTLAVRDLSIDVITGNQEFDVVSCMFALHYFFKTEQTFNTIVESITNNLKNGGIFMATLFDGDSIINRLNYPFNDHEHFNIQQINKTDPSQDKTCFGLDTLFGNTINVSIKDTTLNNSMNYNPNIEYIVNYMGFVNLMKSKGFDLVESRMFNTYDHTKFKLNKTNKDISFLNRMYIFVKL